MLQSRFIGVHHERDDAGGTAFKIKQSHKSVRVSRLQSVVQIMAYLQLTNINPTVKTILFSDSRHLNTN